MDLRVRGVQPGDEAAWRGLWLGYNRFYRREVESRVTDRLWAGLLAGAGPAFGLIADLEGRAVGFAHWFLQPSTSDWGPRLYLQDLYAEEALRGSGIGRALLSELYLLADRHNAAQVWWLTESSNQVAQRLYDRVARRTGFIKYQR